ncbi:MAG TPA: CPBP family glutamic-type intramembrane protease [Parafilimonas sp.]|nr:CPBP family glutamic-type intramembrane protease [Parafilimonas sp.]
MQKFLHFFLVKIIVGIAAIVGVVFLTQTFGQTLLAKTSLSENEQNFILTLLNSGFALGVYIFLFRVYEKRKITELSTSNFISFASLGFVSGFILQSLFVLIIFLFAQYSILHVNTINHVMPALNASLTAGFVAELLIVGIFFRLMEEGFGTTIALIILTIIFVIIHANAKNATWLSVINTALQAGILLPATYVVSRSLWFTIFMHFAWDFAEPGIYGGFNPGNNISKSLFTSKINGNEIITGGLNGPQNSIQALIICLIVSMILLSIAKSRNQFIKPNWKTYNL